MHTFDGIIPVQCKFRTFSEFNVTWVQFYLYILSTMFTCCHVNSCTRYAFVYT